MKVNLRKGGKARLRSSRESFATEKKAPCNRTVILLSIRESLHGINQRSPIDIKVAVNEQE